jgi:hypothetical protein
MKMEFEEPIKSNQSKSDEPRPRQTDWVDTTDSLEAVEAIKWWKNFIFAITLISLLAVQLIFWLANTGIITNPQTPVAAVNAGTTAEQAKSLSTAANSEPNQPGAQKHPAIKSMLNLLREMDRSRLSVFLTIVNTILILGAFIYCLMMLTSVQISIAGRLGGINHICRAFFMSLVLVIFLLPWQEIFPRMVIGTIFSWQELISSCETIRTGDTLDHFVFYSRFCTMWAIVLILLVSTQIRSMRWSKAILRRLEVI